MLCYITHVMLYVMKHMICYIPDDMLYNTRYVI